MKKKDTEQLNRDTLIQKEGKKILAELKAKGLS
jgi:hypothetical protein